MTSTAVTHASGDRLAPFLIAGPPVAAPRGVAGLQDFLAVPPIPNAPPAAEAGAQVAVPPAPTALPEDEAKAKGLLVVKIAQAAKRDPSIDEQIRIYADMGDEANMLDILNAQTLAQLRDWAAGLEG